MDLCLPEANGPILFVRPMFSDFFSLALPQFLFLGVATIPLVVWTCLIFYHPTHINTCNSDPTTRDKNISWYFIVFFWLFIQVPWSSVASFEHHFTSSILGRGSKPKRRPYFYIFVSPQLGCSTYSTCFVLRSIQKTGRIDPQLPPKPIDPHLYHKPAIEQP